ncbi:hypothetical protein Tco_0607165 [Tanacetum coccineum]
MEYKFQDKEYSEDIFSSGSALKDFICVVFVPDRNILCMFDSPPPDLGLIIFEDVKGVALSRRVIAS